MRICPQGSVYRILPAVNVLDDFQGPLLAVLKVQIIVHPRDQMVFEGPLDDLVQEITRDQLVDVSARKMRRKGLGKGLSR